MAAGSILSDVKKMLGIGDDYDHFDRDITMHINSALNIVKQLGVGPTVNYQISSGEETWEDFFTDDTIPMIKSYVYLRVKLLFDPPTNGTLVEAIKEQIREFEWRMNVDVETIW